MTEEKIRLMRKQMGKRNQKRKYDDESLAPKRRKLERMLICVHGEQQVMVSIMENQKREKKQKINLMEENQR